MAENSQYTCSQCGEIILVITDENREVGHAVGCSAR